jgi:hypothetical protein
VLVVLGALFASATSEAQQKVVIYSSNDDTLHKLVFAAFTKETGIVVELVSAGSGVIVSGGNFARRRRDGIVLLAHPFSFSAATNVRTNLLGVEELRWITDQPFRLARVCIRRPFAFPAAVKSTTALSIGRLGDSVPVKCPTDTGSLAGKVAFSPSSRSSSRCRSSFPPFDLSMRTRIASNASASSISSGSAPSSLPAAFSLRSHASFSDAVPCTCDINSSEIRGSGRPSNTGDLCRCFLFPGDV